MQQIKRGDIFYIETFSTTGSEQRPGRPAIIVSNDDNNEHSATVEVVYLTTQPKAQLPTHVVINSSSKRSIAICEQITSVALERIGDYNGHVTDEEMNELEEAMLVSLDLYLPENTKSNEGDVQELAAQSDEQYYELLEQLKAAETKCDMLQNMYDALLNKVIKTV